MDKYIKKLLLLLVGLTPLFGIFEGIGFLRINFGFEMIHVKALKLLVILIILLLCVLKAFLYKFKEIPPFGVFVFLIGIVSAIFASSKEYAFAGLNFLFPFIIMYFTVGIFDREFIRKLTKIVSCLVVLNTMLQLYQMFYMPPYQGLNVLGLTGRDPGFFSNASIAGILAAFSFYLIKYYSVFSKKKTLLLLLVCVLSVLLSMSSAGAGLIVVLIIMPKFLNSRFKGLSYFVLAPIVIVLISNLDTLSGRRSGESEQSFSIRQEILIKQTKEANVFPVDFGKATNMAVNLRRKLNMENNSFIADMMYTATLVNFGWFCFIFILIYTLSKFIQVFNLPDNKKKLFFILCLLVSTSVIISEIFPINYIIAIVGSFYIKSDKIISNTLRNE